MQGAGSGSRVGEQGRGVMVGQGMEGSKGPDLQHLPISVVTHSLQGQFLH